MKTELPAGTIFVMRYRGEPEMNMVVERGGCQVRGEKLLMLGINRPLQAGEVIHRCVWKKDQLLSRQQYTLKEGDFTCVEVPVTGVEGESQEKIVFAASVPKWLREAGYSPPEEPQEEP
jgi:hypothetical protein